MAYNNKIKFGLALDVETSGADRENVRNSRNKYQGIQYAAVIFDAETFEEIEALSFKVKFDSAKYQWTAEAEKVHGLTIEDLAANGLDPQEAATQLLTLIAKYWAGDKPMFLGHNPQFDIDFTDQLLNEIGVGFGLQENSAGHDAYVCLHHVVLDTSALGFITRGIYSSQPLFKAHGIERGNHDALEDVRAELLVCQLAKTAYTIGCESLGL